MFYSIALEDTESLRKKNKPSSCGVIDMMGRNEGDKERRINTEEEVSQSLKSEHNESLDSLQYIHPT